MYIGGDKLGDCGLDGPCAERKADSVERMDHIVEPQPLGADGAGEEDPVEKSQYPCQKSGGGQKKRTGNQRVFPDEILHKKLHKRGIITIYFLYSHLCVDFLVQKSFKNIKRNFDDYSVNYVIIISI